MNNLFVSRLFWVIPHDFCKKLSIRIAVGFASLVLCNCAWARFQQFVGDEPATDGVQHVAQAVLAELVESSLDVRGALHGLQRGLDNGELLTRAVRDAAQGAWPRLKRACATPTSEPAPGPSWPVSPSRTAPGWTSPVVPDARAAGFWPASEPCPTGSATPATAPAPVPGVAPGIAFRAALLISAKLR